MTRSTFTRRAAVAVFVVALIALLASIPGHAARGWGSRPEPASPRVAEAFQIPPVSHVTLPARFPGGRAAAAAVVANDELFGILWPIELEVRDRRGRLVASSRDTTLALVAFTPPRTGDYTIIVRNVLPWPVVAYLWTN